MCVLTAGKTHRLFVAKEEYHAHLQQIQEKPTAKTLSDMTQKCKRLQRHLATLQQLDAAAGQGGQSERVREAAALASAAAAAAAPAAAAAAVTPFVASATGTPVQPTAAVHGSTVAGSSQAPTPLGTSLGRKRASPELDVPVPRKRQHTGAWAISSGHTESAPGPEVTAPRAAAESGAQGRAGSGSVGGLAALLQSHGPDRSSPAVGCGGLNPDSHLCAGQQPLEHNAGSQIGLAAASTRSRSTCSRPWQSNSSMSGGEGFCGAPPGAREHAAAEMVVDKAAPGGLLSVRPVWRGCEPDGEAKHSRCAAQGLSVQGLKQPLRFQQEEEEVKEDDYSGEAGEVTGEDSSEIESDEEEEDEAAAEEEEDEPLEEDEDEEESLEGDALEMEEGLSEKRLQGEAHG